MVSRKKTSLPTLELPYKTFNIALRERFGGRVHKISVDSRLTCPNRDGTKGRDGCIFCLPQNLIKKSHITHASVTEQILAGKHFVQRRFGAKKFIAYFQHNTNTYAPVEHLRELFLEALRVPGVVGLAVSTRPDCVSSECLEMIGELSRSTYLWLEYGLQTANDKTLDAIGRGHSVRDFVDAVRSGLAYPDINLLAHVIAGLPGETTEDILRTVDLVASLGLHGIKVHHLYVVKDTRLYKEYTAGNIPTFTLDEYLDIILAIVARIPPDMVVHRLFGEAPLHLLVAPRWSITKNELMKKIIVEMGKKGIFQGKDYRALGI